MNRAQKIYCLFLTITLGNLPAYAAELENPPEEESGKVYRKYHSDGVVEFTDKPIRGGRELKVEEVPTYKFTSPKTVASPTPSSGPGTKLKTKKLSPTGQYSSLTITSPTRGQTIRANDGNVNVSFNLTPGLKPGHQLVYLLNGTQAMRSSQAQPLINISRGTHTLVLQVVDANNQVLINSDSVSFNVKRFFKSGSP
ncbi:MAG: hypothetical protein OEY52_02545 [Gammaproteobacteria bacterium]|nr:hypothetical protein [Gammaproteobacteria bacterium]